MKNVYFLAHIMTAAKRFKSYARHGCIVAISSIESSYAQAENIPRDHAKCIPVHTIKNYIKTDHPSVVQAIEYAQLVEKANRQDVEELLAYARNLTQRDEDHDMQGRLARRLKKDHDIFFLEFQ